MKKIEKIALVAIILSVSGCYTYEDEAANAVQSLGMTNVHVGGLAPFRCSESDKVGRRFDAVTSRGRPVFGTVCCGVFKGCTVRF